MDRKSSRPAGRELCEAFFDRLCSSILFRYLFQRVGGIYQKRPAADRVFDLTNAGKCGNIPLVKLISFTFGRKGALEMKNQAYRMTMLFDFYGDMLTDRQKEFYDLYYNEDLSLGEIAENYGITRQGVRDVIVRAEAILTELEDKTGLIKRFQATRKGLQAILADAGELAGLAARQDNSRLEELALRIRDTAGELIKE